MIRQISTRFSIFSSCRQKVQFPSIFNINNSNSVTHYFVLLCWDVAFIQCRHLNFCRVPSNALFASWVEIDVVHFFCVDTRLYRSQEKCVAFYSLSLLVWSWLLSILCIFISRFLQYSKSQRAYSISNTLQIVHNSHRFLLSMHCSSTNTHRLHMKQLQKSSWVQVFFTTYLQIACFQSTFGLLESVFMLIHNKL